MKNIKGYVDFINESNNEWIERTVDIPMEEFFSRWFPNKEKIDEDDNYITYEHHDKQYNEKEDEHFWETKKIIKVDKRNPNITHYFEMDLINRPLYKIREKGMTHEQEIKVRSWCGTEKNPKNGGKFEGYVKGLAKFRSYLSNRVVGRLYHIMPDGSFVEMLDEDKIKDKNYVESVIDYLIDTNNLDLIKVVQKQTNQV
jgi:hypothetical protein